jgi:hypothetical protein
LRQHGLSQAWQIFDQQVATSDKAGKRQCDLTVLAEDYRAKRSSRQIKCLSIGIFADRQLFQRTSALHG